LQHALFAYNDDFTGFYHAILREKGIVISYDIKDRFNRLRTIVAMCTEPYTVVLREKEVVTLRQFEIMFNKIMLDKNEILMGADQSIFNNIQKKYF